MKNWRFLIQQEGDRDWLPLEAPEADILEGRYRLVGQFKPGQHPVEIHLAYRDFDSLKTRDRRRTAQTNAKGLVGIFPFSRLQPGLWEIECRSDGEVGSLHLRVDPHDGSPELEASPDLSQLAATYRYRPQHQPSQQSASRSGSRSGSGAAPWPQSETPRPSPDNRSTVPAGSDAAMASVADLFQTVEAVADQVITALSGQLAGGPPASVEAALGRSPAAQIAIELQTSAYRVEAHQPLALQGQIVGSKPEGPSTMTLILITPSTGETIAQHVYPQTITHLPHPFDWPVPLTVAPDTPLVLARLSLHPAASSDRVWPLAECSFAVMVLPAEPGNAPGNGLSNEPNDTFTSDQSDNQSGRHSLADSPHQRVEAQAQQNRAAQPPTSEPETAPDSSVRATNPFQFPEDNVI